MSRLTVFVDDRELPEEEARALWKRFSDHMEAHQGDLRGFAEKEGVASVLPEHGAGKAILRLRKTGEQVPYANARAATDKSAAPPIKSKGMKR